MSGTSSTLADLISQMQKKAPEYVDLLVAVDEQSFELAFGALLEKAVQGLESNSKNFAPLGEEALTAVLALALAVPGLTITQEANSNGHVDITISLDHCFPARKKLGEAKIYKGAANHLGGMEQLLGRYTTGREGQGLMISYVKQGGVSGIVSKLRKQMDIAKPLSQQGKTTDMPMAWSFRSRHKHSCGDVLAIGHVSCNLFVPAKPPK